MNTRTTMTTTQTRELNIEITVLFSELIADVRSACRMARYLFERISLVLL